MKNIKIIVEDDIFERLRKVRGDNSWENLILDKVLGIKREKRRTGRPPKEEGN